MSRTFAAKGVVVEAMALHAAADDAAVQHVKSRKQRGRAVAFVVVGHGPGAPGLHGQTGLGAGERLNLRLLVAARHLPLHPDQRFLVDAVEGLFAALTKRRLWHGAFLGLVDLQAAVNRYLAEHNADPKPFRWTADPHRGRQPEGTRCWIQ
jgi:hypothetical protein